MSRYRFELASLEDDAGLRRRMAEDWLNSRLSVSFRREPSYFTGCEVQGEGAQVIKCTDMETGEIIGMGCRARRTVFINGVPQCAGYLSDLRSHPSVRNRTLLARGYSFLRRLHEGAPLPLYYTVILDGNAQALQSLVGGRAGLPQYRDFGRMLTPAIHLDIPRPPVKVPGVRFERGSSARLPAIVEFIQRRYADKQFAPMYRESDFGTAGLRGFDPADFYVAVKDARIVGTIGAWDQRAFRQTHIEAYTGWFGRMRWLYNLVARMSPLKPLPDPGSRVPYFYAAFIAIEGNDPQIFRGLLREVYRDRRSGEWHYFIAGLHERDPLAQVLREYRSVPAAGRMLVVHFEDGEKAFNGLDGRIPYLEMATV